MYHQNTNTGQYKQCPDCAKVGIGAIHKSLFYKNAARRDGVGAYCKSHTNKRYAPIRLAYNLRKRAASYSYISWQSLFNLVAAYGNRCLRCEAVEDICIDHIKPLSVGGLHSLYNLQPLCRSCNSWKGQKTIDYRLLVE